MPPSVRPRPARRHAHWLLAVLMLWIAQFSTMASMQIAAIGEGEAYPDVCFSSGFEREDGLNRALPSDETPAPKAQGYCPLCIAGERLLLPDTGSPRLLMSSNATAQGACLPDAPVSKEQAFARPPARAPPADTLHCRS